MFFFLHFCNNKKISLSVCQRYPEETAVRRATKFEGGAMYEGLHLEAGFSKF